MDDDPGGLVLRYEYRDTNGTGELGAEVRFGGFAGASSAWFSDDDLLRFADELTTYPLGDSELGISGGYWSGEDFEERVGLTPRAVGRRGQNWGRGTSVEPGRAPHVTSRRLSARFALRC